MTCRCLRTPQPENTRPYVEYRQVEYVFEHGKWVPRRWPNPFRLREHDFFEISYNWRPAHSL